MVQSAYKLEEDSRHGMPAFTHNWGTFSGDVWSSDEGGGHVTPGPTDPKGPLYQVCSGT